MSKDAASNFFIVGGTLDPTAPSYVLRYADEELLRLLADNRYCNIFAARQMGKSSLMVRAAAHLESKGTKTAIVDLTTIGTSKTQVTSEQWYLGLLRYTSRGLDLGIDVTEWWFAQSKAPHEQILITFVEQEILGGIPERVAIFIDEIDSTLSLPFTDEFFGALEYLHTRRMRNPEYNRLAFVLVGVVQPSDLIQDLAKDPYSLDRTVDLGDFSPLDTKTLLPGLEAVHGHRSEAILERVLYWSGGHPYLTQKMCAAIAAESDETWPNRTIDRLAEQLFWEGPAHSEMNLKRIDEYIRSYEHPEQIKKIYRRILAGKRVPDRADSQEINRLKLSGLVKADREGNLQVRNRIYRRAFGPEWAGLSGMEKTTYSISRTLSRLFGRGG
ncbi:MAG: AAA-like domain-containing protein [Anaerolineae bacterium]|nr:AAA-like domain-containing protein [Anaerolineae bacterium]